MRLVALNKNTEKYGYQSELEYGDDNFNGHQIGVAICVQNEETQEIEFNYLSKNLGDKDTRDFALGELLHEKKCVFISETFTQFDDNGELVTKSIYYLPYYVADHSRFKPTVSYENVGDFLGCSCDVQVEVIFSKNGLTRYMTFNFNTHNVSVMDVIYNNIFGFSTDPGALEEYGIKWQDNEEGCGYVLDFYNAAGSRHNLVFSSTEELRDAIVSMRVIDLNHN